MLNQYFRHEFIQRNWDNCECSYTINLWYLELEKSHGHWTDFLFKSTIHPYYIQRNADNCAFFLTAFFGIESYREMRIIRKGSWKDFFFRV